MPSQNAKSSRCQRETPFQLKFARGNARNYTNLKSKATKTTEKFYSPRAGFSQRGNASVVPISEATLSSAVRTGDRKTSTPLSPKPRTSRLDKSTKLAAVEWNHPSSENSVENVRNVGQILVRHVFGHRTSLSKKHVNIQTEVRTTPEPSKSTQSLRQPKSSRKRIPN